MKPKRRVLTARERSVRKRYTRIVKWDSRSYSVFLSVDVQSFKAGTVETRIEAEWMRDMLAVALSEIAFACSSQK